MRELYFSIHNCDTRSRRVSTAEVSSFGDEAAHLEADCCPRRRCW